MCIVFKVSFSEHASNNSIPLSIELRHFAQQFNHKYQRKKEKIFWILSK